MEVFKKERPDIVIHNAAQLSVRVSVEDPLLDADINIMGGLNLIDICEKYDIKKIISASSGGTVYGNQEVFPADELHPQYINKFFDDLKDGKNIILSFADTTPPGAKFERIEKVSKLSKSFLF